MEVKVEFSNVFRRNYNSKQRVVLNEGGARSSKSYSIAQLFIKKLFDEDKKNFLITRKTLPSLRITSYKLFIDLLKQYGAYECFTHNKTFRELRYKDNYLLFTSIDDSTKIQSTEFNYIWMEEAEEFTYDDFITLKTRLSGKKKEDEINQIFLAYNPKKQFSYINKQLKQDRDTDYIHSTYNDNPFLDDDYRQLLQDLKEQNYDYYRIFALGEYADLDSLIYSNIRLVSAETYPESYDYTIYGLDFGWNNPSALLEINIRDRRAYLKEKIYRSRLLDDDLISLMNEQNISKSDEIYCDCAEPDKIEKLRLAGYNVFEADKDVKLGIDFVRQTEIFTCHENVNLNKEREEYVFKKRRDGIVMDEPVKVNDHLMDALRYGLYTKSKEAEPGIRVL